MTREGDRERADSFFHDQAAIVHEPLIASTLWSGTLWSGQDAVDQTGRFELYRQESVGRRLFSVSLLNGTSASRILHQKMQSAREEEC